MAPVPGKRRSEVRGATPPSLARLSRVTVTAGARIHFGLMGFDQSRRPFGGMGMMIDRPSTVVQLRPHDGLVTRVAQSKRIKTWLASWARYHRRHEPDDCVIEIVRRAPAHIGLGSGTQAGLSVARALNAFFGIDMNEPQDLAASVQRARRSSVGSWGFHLGGCVVELGHRAEERLAQDCYRADVPAAWRVLLVRPAHGTGLHGMAEEQAFAGLTQVADPTTARLEELALRVLLPALNTKDLPTFSEGLFEYGRLAGSCFSSLQGGPFASARSADLIQRIRSLGVAAVGQSSWGPLVFAILSDEHHAHWLRGKLRAAAAANGPRFSVVRPKNQGALVEIEAL